jgi:hypothetical protein
MLQGFARLISNLSRSASVDDIVATAAIVLARAWQPPFVTPAKAGVQLNQRDTYIIYRKSAAVAGQIGWLLTTHAVVGAVRPQRQRRATRRHPD